MATRSALLTLCGWCPDKAQPAILANGPATTEPSTGLCPVCAARWRLQSGLKPKAIVWWAGTLSPSPWVLTGLPLYHESRPTPVLAYAIPTAELGWVTYLEPMAGVN